MSMVREMFKCSLVLSALLTVCASASAQTFSNNTPILIPAGAPGLSSGVSGPYPSEIVVAGVAGPLCKVTVTLHDFSHSFSFDLTMLLVGPGGQRCMLMGRVGGGSDWENATVTFDDLGPPISEPVAGGTYRPTVFLSDDLSPPAPAGPYSTALGIFDGTSANGTWRLYIEDNAGGDFGEIASGWSLNVTTGIEVTNTNTSGAGSLRQAIIDANANADLSFICFNIPGAGPHTISPGAGMASLPAITQPVVIDGLSQTGSVCDGTWPPTLSIILDGTSAGGGANGLSIVGGGSTVRGLRIQNFGMDGVQFTLGNGNKVQSCFLIENGRDGVCIDNGSMRNHIGVESKTEASACQGNLISGNGRDGVFIGTDFNVVAGNRIGTNAAGDAALGNDRAGVAMVGFGLLFARCNRIGTDGDGFADVLERNVISGNATGGVGLSTASGNVVAGNFIGVGADGVLPLGNGTNMNHPGVGFAPNTPNNRIGAQACNPNPVEGNIIANNAGDGISMVGAGDASIRNSFVSNSIYNNGALGICFVPSGPNTNDALDADTGPNRGQNYPVISSADAGIIDGTLNSLPNWQFRLEFFANTAADPSGHGEGEQLVASVNVITDALGDAVFSVAYTPVAGKEFISGTATSLGASTAIPCTPAQGALCFDVRGEPVDILEIYNTSEFSPTVTERGVATCILECPEDITQAADPETCTAEVTFGPLLDEDCIEQGYVVVCSIDDTEIESPYEFPVGSTTVTCELFAPTGESLDECTFDVFIFSVGEPTITCPDDVEVSADTGMCSASVSFEPELTFPCIEPDRSTSYEIICTLNGVEITSPYTFPVGVHTVQCCVFDGFPPALGGDGEPGLPIDCCTFTVTVTDDEEPILDCRPGTIEVFVGECGNVVLNAQDFVDSFTDNCPLDCCGPALGGGQTPTPCGISISPEFIECPQLNTEIVVTLTAIDCHGNTATCTATIIVRGNDCNGNGYDDACDVCSGTSLDCNDNWVPDECECYWCNVSQSPTVSEVPQPDVNAQLSHLGGGTECGEKVADDFYLEPGCAHRITAVRGRLLTNSNINLLRARLELYEDCNGKPADEPFFTADYNNPTGDAIPSVVIGEPVPAADGFSVVSYRFDLCDQCIWLEGGKTYWVSIIGLTDNIDMVDLSYWIAGSEYAPMLGNIPVKRSGTPGSTWGSCNFGPWESIEDCCIGCVNMDFCVDGYACPILWDNGDVDLVNRGGSPSGAHMQYHDRTADSFVVKTCEAADVCMIEAWIWTNCADPICGFIELYEDLGCEPRLDDEPFVRYECGQIDSKRFNETLVIGGRTFHLWRLRVKNPALLLASGHNYWVSAGAQSAGNFSANSFFAWSKYGCDPCNGADTFRITPGQHRTLRPPATDWADVNPARDFAFTIAVRARNAIPQDDEGPMGEGQSSPVCMADANNDGNVGVDDIFAFLSAWFVGCP
jgi:hypothetical protein